MSSVREKIATIGATALTVCVLGVVGGLLLIAAEPSVVAWVDVNQNVCEVLNDTNPVAADRCIISGFERHGGALLLIGALAIGLSILALGNRSRLPAVALLAIGVLVLAIALIGDLPETTRTGQVGNEFDEAAGRAGFGFYMELAGGMLCAIAGSLQLLARRGRAMSPSPAPRTRTL